MKLLVFLLLAMNLFLVGYIIRLQTVHSWLILEHQMALRECLGISERQEILIRSYLRIQAEATPIHTARMDH